MSKTNSKIEKLIKVRRNIRDSVFNALIENKKFLRRVYLSLHSEDTAVTEDDLCLVHTESVFIGAVVHDCCFTVRNKTAIYIEVQSTPCAMLPYRMGRYWGNTLENLNEEYKDKQYSLKGVKMPDVEFYTLYVGKNAENVPNCIGLKSENGFLDISIWVKTEYNSIGIIKEYCVFSHIYADNVEMYKGDRESIVAETLRECLEKDLLNEFLMEKEEEVRKIMSEANEYEFKMYLNGVIKDSEAVGEARGRAEGKAEGEAKGRAEEAKNAEDKFKSILKEEGYSEDKLNELLKKFAAV